MIKIKKNRFVLFSPKGKKGLKYDLRVLLSKLKLNFDKASSCFPINKKVVSKNFCFSFDNTFVFMLFFFFLKRYLNLFFFKSFYYRTVILKDWRFSKLKLRKKVLRNGGKIQFNLYNFFIFICSKNILRYFRYFKRFPCFNTYRYFITKLFFIDSKIYLPSFDNFISSQETGLFNFRFLSKFRHYILNRRIPEYNFKKRASLLLKERFFVKSKIYGFNIIYASLYTLVSKFSNLTRLYKKSSVNPLLYDCVISLNRNNIFLTIYRKLDGKVITSCSAGNVGFKGKKKKTPPSAKAIALKFTQQVKRKLSKKLLSKIKITLKFYGNFTSFLVKEAYNGLFKGGLKFVGLLDCVKKEHSLGIRRKKARRV